MTQDTVVVAAGAAWGFYLRHSAYVCQAGRAIRPVRWIGFYRSKRIEPLVPEIVERRGNVSFTHENAKQLAARGQKYDTDIARVIARSLDEGSRAEGAVHDVYLLTSSDDPYTNRLRQPVAHRGSTAWTMGQRYASLEHLVTARSTAELGIEKVVPPITEADLLGPIHVVRQHRRPVRPSLASSSPPPSPSSDHDGHFVQFMHPGGEHGEDRPGWKGWNLHDHRRKFICIEGEYMRTLDEDPRRDELVFWGEWEPESRVEAIPDPVHGGPRWVHRPYYVRPDSYTRDGRVLQNTDPYVFGSSFQYTLCRQLRQGRPTFLRDLAPGSLILFGSSKAGQFVLDTVFVTADSVLHTDEDWSRTLAGRVDQTYEDVTLRPTYEWGSAHLRHYRGATHSNPVDGMFSFAPCMTSAEWARGFKRPAIHLDTVVTQALAMGAKSTPSLSSSDVHGLWLRVVEQVIDQGLYLGVLFDTPREELATSG